MNVLIVFWNYLKAQFAGSSSVPEHVEMMRLIGIGNNPMVGATVAVAVCASQASAKKQSLILQDTLNGVVLIHI